MIIFISLFIHDKAGIIIHTVLLQGSDRVNHICKQHTPLYELMEIQMADAQKQLKKYLFYHICSAFAGKSAQMVNEKVNNQKVLTF